MLSIRQPAMFYSVPLPAKKRAVASCSRSRFQKECTYKEAGDAALRFFRSAPCLLWQSCRQSLILLGRVSKITLYSTALIAHKTVNSIKGQKEVVQVGIGILKLTSEVFPFYHASLQPVLIDLIRYRSLCNALSIIPAFNNLIHKKISFGSLSSFFISISALMQFIQEAEIFGSKLSGVSVSTGRISIFSLKGAVKFCFSKTGGILIEFSCLMVQISWSLYQAKNHQERVKVLSTEKLLLIARCTGRVTLLCLSGTSVPFLCNSIEILVGLAGYTRFLISPKE
jgi:hypothetical protein